MKRTLLITLLVLLSCPAFAVVEDSFIYAKTVLKIVPKPGTSTPVPAEKADKKPDDSAIFPKGPQPEPQPEIKRVPKEVTVEVRSPAFLTQTDFITHQPFTDEEGMLILVDPPAVAQVTATRMMGTADVLFVDEDGYIIKIAPELKISGLAEPVDSGKPIRAFVYLKAGTAAASDIQPGDRIENSYFKTHPTVIQ